MSTSSMSLNRISAEIPPQDEILAAPSIFPRCSRPYRILWVDDSRSLLSLYQAIFEGLGFEVVVTPSPLEALDRLSWEQTDVAILDYDMPEMDGGALASMMKSRVPEMPVILYTGSTKVPRHARECVDAICAKASPREELLLAIERLLRRVADRHSEARQPVLSTQSAAS
jgi:DNA-binding NtrC family response regulator